ncbi:MAG: hypothetical protein IJ974_00875 [Phascolarctobacterium sp.]|nr:hypothetical protein [Phascolarctobacterium sp.]MBR2219531.1 hypothetical protein [Phascolarctobacterium sp.]
MEILFLTRTAGIVLETGLPNITGSANNFIGADGGTGAFRSEAINVTWTTPAGSYKKVKLYIDASLCSSIYGKSNTVQPPAITCCFYIKY